MNPIETISTAIKAVKDIRKDPELAGGMIAMLNIAQGAALKCAAQSADQKISDGFNALNEALAVVVDCLENGIGFTAAVMVPKKLMGLRGKLEGLGDILKDETNPVTQSFIQNITTADGFDKAFTTVLQKADGKMLKMEPLADGGMDVTELVSGQNIRLFRASAEDCDRAHKLLAGSPEAQKNLKKKFG